MREKLNEVETQDIYWCLVELEQRLEKEKKHLEKTLAKLRGVILMIVNNTGE